MKEGETSGVKTFWELARPLTSAYVCLCGHRVRAHPASSAAINCDFQHHFRLPARVILHETN